MADNKIRYGISKLYYAVATIANDGSATYGEPVAIPGAVSISLSPRGNNNDFYADNIVYWTGAANNGYEGELEVANLPEAFETDILGLVADSKEVQVESTDPTATHFALMFQFEGDNHATRHVLYNCTAERPDVESETKTEDIDPQTVTININAASVFNASLNKDIVKAKTNSETDSATYTSWFTAVYLPTAGT